MVSDTLSLTLDHGETSSEQPIDGYRFERLLGVGGMGVVYEATQLTLDRRVAIKLLHPRYADDDLQRARFRREALLQAALHHPHILDIYETGVCESGLFIVMRLVEGETLKARLAAGPLEPERALALLGPVADALDTAHGCGVVHRDVKPENILIGPRSHAYLADFGLVRALADDALTSQGGLLGTLSYLAPERLRGEDASPSSDVYSFAAVLHEALAPEADDALVEVLRRGLAFDAAARPASAVELIERIEAALRKPVATAAAVDVPPAPPTSRPAPATALLAVFFLALLAAGHWAFATSTPAVARLTVKVERPVVTVLTQGTALAPQFVSIEANVTAVGAVVALRITCEVVDVDEGRPLGLMPPLRPPSGMAETFTVACGLPLTLVPHHRYRATVRVFPSDPSLAALASRSSDFWPA